LDHPTEGIVGESFLVGSFRLHCRYVLGVLNRQRRATLPKGTIL